MASRSSSVNAVESAFSTSPNARAPTRPYSASACFCSAVRTSTWPCSAPPVKSGALIDAPHLHERRMRPARTMWRADRRSGAPHGIVAVLEHEELARDAADRGGEGDARQARRLRLLDAVERRGYAPLGGDHVRTALQEFRGHAHGHRPGYRGELRRNLKSRGRIAAGER